jgi:DNA topoisomerase-1
MPAATPRLRLSCDRAPGIRRERAGAKYRYRTADGRLVRAAAVLARIRGIVIPPAWEDVWICPAANGHIQATGRDARGRKQYRYHPAFRAARDGEKFGRMLTFGTALPGIRRAVRADLRQPGLPREKVLAAVVQLLDRTALRVGNPEYARDNNSFGLSTMLDRHAAFRGSALHIKFRGKGGVWHERAVTDKALVRVVRNCRDLPGQDLFQYRTADGRRRAVRSTDVNRYVREIGGGPYTAKDFRTWAGTVAAVKRFLALPPPASKTAGERAVVGVIKEVAAELGNTPAVCRKSYVHPKVIDAFLAGTLAAERGRKPEACLLRLLRSRNRRSK